MADNDRKVCFRNQPITLDYIPQPIFSVITQIRRIGVMVDYSVRPELLNDLLAEIPLPLFPGVFPVKPHRAEKGYVPEFCSTP